MAHKKGVGSSKNGRESHSQRLGIKASGGIRTREFALELLSAGATRLGTSASVGILRPDSPATRSAST